MPAHLHSSTLHHSGVVTIYDVCCRPHDSRCGGEERASVNEIAFPRRGLFVKHVAGRAITADANSVLFFNADEPYRISHPADGGDDCTVHSFRVQALTDALSSFEPAAADRPGRPFSLSHGPCEPGVCLAHQRLRGRLRSGLHDPLATDEAAAALLEAAVASAFRIRGMRRGSATIRASTVRAHRDWADAARQFAARHFTRRLSLDDFAAAVHCSPFHLARLFRCVTGLTLHAHVDRLRLRAALERLANDEPDLTTLALDLGYGSHSHFTTAFRSEFGLSPSEFRRSATRRRLREMSRNLKV